MGEHLQIMYNSIVTVNHAEMRHYRLQISKHVLLVSHLRPQLSNHLQTFCWVGIRFHVPLLQLSTCSSYTTHHSVHKLVY